jgi:hypothetical protein
MRNIILTLALLLTTSLPAFADACGDLVRQAEQQLSSPSLDGTLRSQLQQLLDVGKAGDLARCEGATGSINQSPMPGASPTGRQCIKTPDTV